MFQFGDDEAFFDPANSSGETFQYKTFEELKEAIRVRGPAIARRGGIVVVVNFGKCPYCPRDHFSAFRRDGLLTRAYNIDEKNYGGDPAKMIDALLEGGVLDKSLEEQILTRRFEETLPEELYFSREKGRDARRSEYIRNAYGSYHVMREIIRQTKQGSEERARLTAATELAYNVGRIFTEVVAQQDIEQAAISHYAQAEEAKEMRAKGSAVTRKKAELQREACRELVGEAAKRFQFDFAVAGISKKAEIIRSLAEKTRPQDFQFQKGKLRPLSWFIERIEDLHATGELAKIIKAAIQNA